MLGCQERSCTDKAVAYAASQKYNRPHQDYDLIKRCQNREPGSFEALSKKYSDSIQRFAFSLCNNHEDVNDIVAQVNFLLYHRIHTYRGEASFSSWLFRIVKNVYVDTCIRSTKNHPLSLDDPLIFNGEAFVTEIPDLSASPEQTLLMKERSWRLNNAISHLPEYQRDVMIYHAEGKSHDEIANITGLSIGTIKSRLNRARTSLRERLGHMYELFLVS